MSFEDVRDKLNGTFSSNTIQPSLLKPRPRTGVLRLGEIASTVEDWDRDLDCCSFLICMLVALRNSAAVNTGFGSFISEKYLIRCKGSIILSLSLLLNGFI